MKGFLIMFQVPAEKGRLLVLIYFKVKNKNDINMRILHLSAKELEVYYNPKMHTKEQLMAKVGDALCTESIFIKIDPETVISRTNVVVTSTNLLHKCRKHLENKKQEKMKKNGGKGRP